MNTIMKTKLLILAIVGLALVSCSNDTITERSQNDVISFRPLLNNTTRAANAAGLKSAWEAGDKLYVYADYKNGKFFQDEFVKDGTGFNSSNKYYWPKDLSTNNVTFTAFWGAAQKTWETAGDENKLNAAYEVDASVANQMDLLFAKKTVDTKPTGGVVMNFRHLLSQVIVKVANDQAGLNIIISGVKIGYVSKSGTFSYTGTSTDTQETGSKNATLIARTDWGLTAAAAANVYEQNATATLDGSVPSESLTGFTSWILMPQLLSPATDYTERATSGAVTTATPPTLNGAYIALKMEVKTKGTSVVVVPEQWCYWPINTEWKPGYKYTYTVNVGSGGYQPTDQNNTAGLDPVIDDLVIWFSPSCTIDTWVDEAVPVTVP
jgi:hypothetical protein